MKNILFILIALTLFSCGKKEDDALDLKKKELELKERELTLKEKELNKEKSEESKTDKTAKSDETTGKTDITSGNAEIKSGEMSYKNYTNDRYGYTVMYPADITPMAEAPNGDGREFKSDDGNFRLTVYGSNLIDNNSIDYEYKLSIDELDRVTYNKKGKGWFAVSGYKNGKIVYQKTLYGSGSLNTVLMEYSKSEKEKYDKVVETIVGTFKAGKLNQSR